MEGARKRMVIPDATDDEYLVHMYWEYAAPFTVLEDGKNAIFDIPGFGDDSNAINTSALTVM